MAKKIICLAVLLIPFLSSCTSSGVLTGSQQDAVLAFADPMTDNLINGISTGSYVVFSKDFDDAMLKAMTESSFNAMLQKINTNEGAYQLHKVAQVTTQNNYIIVIYVVNFERVKNVNMRVVFTSSTPHKISGLWFSQL